MERGRKFFYDITNLIQWDDHTKLEAKGTKISYDPIFNLHCAEEEKKIEMNSDDHVHREKKRKRKKKIQRREREGSEKITRVFRYLFG